MKLNLGCGNDYRFEWINVDFYHDSKCDVKHNLEVFPWPWEDNSISEILIKHTLEHLGEDWRVFVKILQEMYRICENEAKIEVHVPSPWHWNYISDPTHVRPIIPDTFNLFNKEYCQQRIDLGGSETPLAMIYDIDLRPYDVAFIPDVQWQAEINTGKMNMSDIMKYHNMYRNVISEFQIPLTVVK
jgi:hypothetical protein